MPLIRKIYSRFIIAAPVAMMFFSSCRNNAEVEPMDMEQIPVQEVFNMEVLQSDNAILSMRMSAPLMQHFEYYKDSVDHIFDLYPNGIHVDAYTEDGALETVVDADHAKHETTGGGNSWMAYGNVRVKNIINGQTITSDTIYWDQKEKRIFTDCYVRVESSKGLLQGYGMMSDERANNTVLRKPFDSYSAPEDTSNIEIDTLNFIGPLRKK